MVLVKLFDAIEILLQLHLVQSARFIQERDQRLATGLHLLAQNSLAEMLVALEVNPAHRSFHTLIHRINDSSRTSAFINRLDPKIDRDIGEPLALISVDDFLPRLL